MDNTSVSIRVKNSSSFHRSSSIIYIAVHSRVLTWDQMPWRPFKYRQTIDKGEILHPVSQDCNRIHTFLSTGILMLWGAIDFHFVASFFFFYPTRPVIVGSMNGNYSFFLERKEDLIVRVFGKFFLNNSRNLETVEKLRNLRNFGNFVALRNNSNNIPALT